MKNFGKLKEGLQDLFSDVSGGMHKGDVIVDVNRKNIEMLSFLNRTSTDWNTLVGTEIRNVKLEYFRKLLKENIIEYL